MLKRTILVLILTTSSAWAQQPTAAPVKQQGDSRGSDKLDIKKLEQKYWAAKDDDFSVVQNRRYSKADRFYFNLAGGIAVNDPHETGTIFSGQFGYFFNERWGVDVNYSKANMSENDATTFFYDQYGAIPDHTVFDSSTMLSATYVPLYAKMSFVDRAIIYFDMGISVGVGMTDYIQRREDGDKKESAFAYQIGINQQIFFSEHFAVRVDFINKFTNEKQIKWDSGAANRDLGNKVINDTSLLLGLTYWH
ncbi:hypothetical protein D3C87_445680 [compost metagenome]